MTFFGVQYMSTISVCMATYNGVMYIEDQLRSILPQLSDDDEVIISDDASTDRTLSVVNAFHDPRIKIFHNRGPCSPILNFENALRHCSGDFILLSDQDDIWLSGKVDILRHLLTRFDVVVSDCQVVDSNLQIIYHSFFSVNKSKKGFLNNVIKNSYLGCCLAFKKDILKIALPFPRHIPMHDWWIGIVAECFFKTSFVPYTLICYRRHGNNASIAGSKSSYGMTQRFLWRLQLIYSLIIRIVKTSLQ
ncbi:UDP-Glc:alpha-D-GlcNAc-diphosphoundecaprenol beta-1,3-glucosyltransferase WfgD [anaerobic digester metagenome]